MVFSGNVDTHAQTHTYTTIMLSLSVIVGTFVLVSFQGDQEEERVHVTLETGEEHTQTLAHSILTFPLLIFLTLSLSFISLNTFLNMPSLKMLPFKTLILLK